MSSDGFHVHGPHEHELEHAAAHEPKGLAGQLAVATAVIATVGALFGYMGGATQAGAGLNKNDAAIRKTEAANQWSFYQAKSNKQNLSEIAADLAPAERRTFYLDEAKRYKGEKNDIMVEAKRLDEESKSFDRKSEELMHQHHRWAQATTALQISIAMAAIALLTKSVWLEKFVFVLSGIGVVVGALAWFHI